MMSKRRKQQEKNSRSATTSLLLRCVHTKSETIFSHDDEKSTYRRVWLRQTQHFPGQRVWGVWSDAMWATRLQRRVCSGTFAAAQFSPRVEIFKL